MEWRIKIIPSTNCNLKYSIFFVLCPYNNLNNNCCHIVHNLWWKNAWPVKINFLLGIEFYVLQRIEKITVNNSNLCGNRNFWMEISQVKKMSSYIGDYCASSLSDHENWRGRREPARTPCFILGPKIMRSAPKTHRRIPLFQHNNINWPHCPAASPLGRIDAEGRKTNIYLQMTKCDNKKNVCSEAARHLTSSRKQQHTERRTVCDQKKIYIRSECI